MRIALATVGTRGDVIPFRALARRLVDRGHEVTAVTWPVHAEFLAVPGVRVEVAGPHADPRRIAATAAAAARQGPMEQVATLRDFHLADGSAHYRALRALLRGHDLVLLHGIHAIAHAAVLYENLPWASVTFDPVLLATRAAPPPGMPNIGPANRLLWGMVDRALARTARPLDDMLARAGSAQQGLPLFRARSQRLHLVACSPSIIVVPPDLPRGTQVTGAWLDDSEPDPLPDDLARFLDEGPPPIVITFGSMAGMSTSELADTVRAVLNAGRRVVAQSPTGVSSPNLVEVGSVDHRLLFPSSGLVVHHGGAGTTHAACAAGVPSVVVPQIGDQRYWADRLRRLGVAPDPVRLAQGMGSRLADAITAAAADPRLAGAASALGQRLRRESGLDVAVEALEAVTRRL